jgi:hypothetical protein
MMMWRVAPPKIIWRMRLYKTFGRPLALSGGPAGALLALAAACGFIAWRSGRAPRRPFDGIDEVNIAAIEDLPAEPLNCSIAASAGSDRSRR